MNTSSAPSRTLPVSAILLAAVAAAVGLWLGSRMFGAPAQPKLENAVLYPAPRTIPPFHLVQANGQALDNASWHGRWNVVYFGYTSCPDVCPTTLATFKQAWKDLGARGLADRVRFDFVSVDPGRDTPELLAKYVAYFSPDFVAATGTDEELTPLTRALGLVYARSTDADGKIEVDHSGSAVIVDPDGRLVGMFRPPFAAHAVADDLATLAGTQG
ncbi:MAG TPA: SCO family protein [Rudaea sp.]|nr:SCO family protein [Rudaea sp.]